MKNKKECRFQPIAFHDARHRANKLLKKKKGMINKICKQAHISDPASQSQDNASAKSKTLQENLN